MRCQIDGCTAPQLDGRPFCCKKHWPKVPRKIKSELNKLYDSGNGSITVINLNRLGITANFALDLPDSWEKRAKFYFKKEAQKKSKERILIVTGTKQTKSALPLWNEFWAIAHEVKIANKLHITKDFDDTPHRVALVLGQAGYIKTLPKYKVHNGIVHMGQEAVTPAGYISMMWAQRPTAGTYKNNIYVRSCEAHPEEYESFKEDELNEIKKCLEWTKGLM